jgi:hypothetical protein
MALAYLRRLAGAQPAPKRTTRVSWVAASVRRTTRGAQPAPYRTRRASAIFKEGFWTTSFSFFDIGSLLDS